MMSWNGTWSWGNWIAMSLVMIVFWTLLVVAAVSLLRTRRTTRHSSVDVGPQQILDQRFARGEISDGEYRRRGESLRAARHGD